MFRLMICSLLVGLSVVAISAQPITSNKVMTIEDLEADDRINIIRGILLDCMLEEKSWKTHLGYMEEGLISTMAEKNFSAFSKEFLKNITATREAKCAPGSNPEDYTSKPGYDFRVIATYQSPDYNGLEYPENGDENSLSENPEKPPPEDNTVHIQYPPNDLFYDEK